MFVIDYAFARPAPAATAAAGYKGVLRYVCPANPATQGKLITPAEKEAIRAAGLDLTLNFEWYETRPTKGYQAGVDDALVADQQADAVGYPLECAIYYSVDFGATWPQVADYFRGVHATSRRPVGVYGGLAVIAAAQDAGYAKYGWVTNAASWSGQPSWTAVRDRAVPPRYHLLQHLHSNTPYHIPGVEDVAFDPNTVVQAEYGQWHAGDDVTPQDIQAIADAVDTKLNRVIGTLQQNMKAEWIPAIVTGVTKAVVKALPPGSTPVDPDAVAKAAADEVAKRLSNG